MKHLQDMAPFSTSWKGADHISVCRPVDEKSRSFYALTNFLHRISSHSKATLHGIPNYPTSLQRRVFDVQVKLLLNLPDLPTCVERQSVHRASAEHNCLVLGIVGMGGIGKTTIAKAVYNNISPQFEYTCFVDNVKGIKAHKLNDWILNHFLWKGTVVDQNSLQWSHLQKVVQKCDGLPLTLEVLGSYLRSHKTNATIWKETLDKLGEAQAVDGIRNDRVWASLRLSYDALCPEEQGMFREAGIYFFEKPVERALAAWSTAYRYPETRWANLLRTSMVKGVPKTKWDKFGTKIEYEEVWVHEHLRDLAASLSGEAMLDGFKAVDRFNANPVEAKTSILRLQFFPEYPEYFDEYPAYQLELLDKMDKLKYLELLHVQPEGSRSNFPRKLSLLKWHSRDEIHVRNQVAPTLPISLEYMNNLAVLELQGWEMREENVEGMGKLSNLRILSLCHIEGPSGLLQNFGYLSQLRQLELRHVELTELPHSFGTLEGLQRLVLDCIGIVELPETSGNLTSLLRFIGGCEKLASLPESFGSLSKLAVLLIRNCARLKCPQLTDLGQFDLRASLSSLTYLRLESCTSLVRLPASFGVLSSLEEFELLGCTQLTELPESIGQFKCLESLTIQRVPHLEALPDSLGNLAAVTFLNLNDCESLQRLPATFGNFSALQQLVSADCPQIQKLPENFGQLRALEKLTIVKAHKLEALSDDFGNLTSLTHLKLHFCDGLERIPESFGLLSTLQELHLDGCRGLQRLPDNFRLLSALKTLNIRDADHLEVPPDSFKNLSSLEHLELSATTLQSFPESVGQLRALRKLTVCGPGLSLNSLPEEVGRLSSLEVLTMDFCHGLLSKHGDPSGQFRAHFLTENSDTNRLHGIEESTR